MSSRYDELERLQRLRESGALTDEEFQTEKRRILGHEAGPEPEPAPAANPGDEQRIEVAEARPSRLPLYLIAAGAALIVAIVAGLWLGRIVGGTDEGTAANVSLPANDFAADANLIQPQAPADVHTLAPAEQIARAFEAAFGAHGSATVKIDAGKDYGTDSFPEEVRYAPGRLIWATFGPVLISEGEVKDAAHVSAGRIAVHYLRPAADRFEVARAFPSAVVTGSSGKVARWSVSQRFSDWPVIVSEGGGMWQGYACSWLKLTELRPGGPVHLATIPLSYDDTGAQEDETTATAIEGKMINIVRNQSFDMVYSGARSFSEHWVRSGDAYALAGGGKSAMETC
ncbi:MAG TPA: SHOCT domain-containing protein [Allosphingosinicella sp.]|jgi:hypothetical protein